MNKIKIYILFPVLLLSGLNMVNAQKSNDATIFKAMLDELVRNKAELKIEESDPPFLIRYDYQRANSVVMMSSLGALLQSEEVLNKSIGAINMALGDYNFNSDCFYKGALLGLDMPTEVDYTAIRRRYWQISDVAYKMSLNYLAQKANFYNAEPPSLAQDELGDLKPITPLNRTFEFILKESFNKEQWENNICKLSRMFIDYPKLENSLVVMRYFSGEIYTVSTEGVVLKLPQNMIEISISARTKTDDGETIEDQTSVVGWEVSDLPSLDVLAEKLSLLADGLMKRREAREFEDFYSGPVLFENEAAKVLFLSALVHEGALIASRPIVGDLPMNQLVEYKDKKIIDSRIAVHNYAGLANYKGHKLFGAYAVDGDGVVPPDKTLLVEYGMLKEFLCSRYPTPYAPSPTGSVRFSVFPDKLVRVIAPGTIQITAEKTTKHDMMKKELIKSAKKSGAECAYIVRNISETGSELYQVDLRSGEEILIRSANIQKYDLQNMRRLGAISDSEIIDNYLYDGLVLSSLICPTAVIVNNVEISKSNAKRSNPLPLKFPLDK